MRCASLIAWSLPTLLVALVPIAGCSSPAADDAESSAGSAYASGNSSNAQVNTGISGLNIRSGPTSTSASVGGLAPGAAIDVQCQTRGESVGGNDGWDYLSKYHGYVSDRYVTKLGASFPSCNGDPALTPTASPSPSSSPSPPPPGGGGDGGGPLVTEARRWVGTHETGVNCNPFSTALGRPCEGWCADFVEYVWQQGGMSTDGVTGYAGSFLAYGSQFGTLKPRDSTDVQPGDAVVWANTATDAAHVGIVSEVLANGDVRVISGNYSDQVMETVSARSSRMSGYAIAGFVSPVSL